MKCFIHQNVDAIATCKRCGKAMCVNCSAYSNHTGICPECRCEDYEKEVAGLKSSRDHKKSRITKAIVWACVLVAVLIVICALTKTAFPLIALLIEIWPLVVIVRTKDEIKEMTPRIEWLDAEIAKLKKHLNVGSSILNA